MATFNRWIGLGNLTRDPERRDTTKGGVTLATLAVDRRRPRSMSDKQPDTLFIDLEVWGRPGEILAEYARKGRSLLVEGQLRLDKWEKDGAKHSKILCVVDSFQFLGPRPGENPPEDLPF